tara:strand:+ start:146 stop:523 length:378 start_codon:yes stop_codon:yes gene_type:complete
MGRGLRQRRIARASKEVPFDYHKGWNRRPDIEEYDIVWHRHGRYRKAMPSRLRSPYECYCGYCTQRKDVAVDRQYHKHKGDRYGLTSYYADIYSDIKEEKMMDIMGGTLTDREMNLFLNLVRHIF